MTDNRAFKIKCGGVLNSEVFEEASREELRVLVAIMDKPLFFTNEADVAAAAKVSRARASAAIALFSEAGILVREGDVSYEFKEQNEEDDIVRDGKEVAETIRKKSLAELFDELARLMGKEALNTDEVKKITSLITDRALNEDYILSLAAHLAARDKLTVFKLVRKAKQLEDCDIDSPETLETYIKNAESEGGLVFEFKQMFGVYTRNVQKTELEFFRKWREVYAFSTEIIALAQDITVTSTAKLSYSYMDKLLDRWHECGCKTVEECRDQSARDRAAIAEEKRKQKEPSRKTQKSVAPTPKYGNFNAMDGLMKALERSYGESEEEKPQ